MRLLLPALAASIVCTAGQIHAQCSNDVPISSISNAFPAYEALTDAMAACGNFEATLDTDYQEKIFDALGASPSIYTMSQVTNSTSTLLLDAGLIRPMDDLVEKYGQDLDPSQLIRVDGETVALATIVNTQHLMYREDIFADLGLTVPTTWDELIETGKAIQAAGVVDYPYGSYYKTGWNLGFVFINHYFGEGGEFFADDNSPNIDRAKAKVVLERMQALSELMDPEYLVSDSTYVTKQLQQGKIAMATLWASRAGAVNDPAESAHPGKIIMSAAMKGSETASATLWWGGFSIAKNVTDAEAEAAFKALMETVKPEFIEANNDLAIWVSPAFKPGAAAIGAFETAKIGPPNFPGTKRLGLMHTALGQSLPNFLTGQQSADDVLDAVEAAYVVSAKEEGLVQ